MVLNWEFAYVDDSGREIVTRTAQDLLQEVTYPVAAHVLIDEGLAAGWDYVNDLFVSSENGAAPRSIEPQMNEPQTVVDGTLESWEDEYGEQHYRGQIMNLNPTKGYGFIKYPPNNLFFYRQDLENVEITQLQVGDTLEFQISLNDEGDQVAKHLRYVER